MENRNLPPITDELINGLDSVFPQRHPDLSLSDREIWYKAGQRYVVDFLIEQQLRQKETMLTERVLEN
ncbi:hypothetical protein PSCSP2_00013 [Prochlorococcus phage P-SCSP2]|nr:hypothetical protein PSCSP2_00013 [Prochlorococcus phage P-SCSP2]